MALDSRHGLGAQHSELCDMNISKHRIVGSISPPFVSWAINNSWPGVNIKISLMFKSCTHSCLILPSAGNKFWTKFGIKLGFELQTSKLRGTWYWEKTRSYRIVIKLKVTFDVRNAIAVTLQSVVAINTPSIITVDFQSVVTVNSQSAGAVNPEGVVAVKASKQVPHCCCHQISKSCLPAYGDIAQPQHRASVLLGVRCFAELPGEVSSYFSERLPFRARARPFTT